ncbi:trafficking protein particle complex subunit 8 isoform X3 [Callorhinchus milii]|uniref:trafficking protein particle complex subunit 8 isoform X3 n=1 Tax=Callorhinchus milii TaxID=7868 RepID=UPI0004572923|nr:trafficking protein particle complex subunit 8 isoform X3 [Callorhinchus milii]|eukprot:gi/632954947/ref/XP_007893230.1/ PREDICTED: trafficking protein particle complex subunit 8 isoform X3 [Callorhinchus milii]
MAQCVQSVQEFLQDTFVPTVAALCSPEAEAATRKNNLSFAELVRPFCRLTSEVHMRDPNNQLHVIKNLKISVTGIVTQSPQQAAIRKLLNDVVSASQPAEGLVANVITAGDYDLNISDRSVKASVPWYSNWKETLTQLSSSKFHSATTPWFEAYRECFFQSMPASDHEFLHHYLACMLVVSSKELDPVEQFLKLSQEQHRIQHNSDYSYPKWFIPNTLKYYVLLHDVSEGDEQRAESTYEEIKQRYGSQGCYLLKFNSRTPLGGSDEQIPDPWSQYLNRSNLQSQEICEDGPTSLVTNKNKENSIKALEVEGTDISIKDGVANNYKSHPLQQAHSKETHTKLEELDGTSKPVGTVNDGIKQNSLNARGLCLTLTDHDRIRQFIQEFTFRGLLPHIEKTIRQLNDQLISRKGLSRSLFTATKKWFSGSKVPEKSTNELKSTTSLLYPLEAPELQIRKMADLCFLVQHYDLAYSCYHTAKKDFLNDQAMLYAAGALEMAAASVFLQPGAQRQYPAHYMETAIQTYKDVCKNLVLAERCALLSAEILKSQVKYSEAATLLIRMTSEDSDLRSALLLEQAAHCFINMRTPMVRKFAFHMILAGHRFSKADQRKHALRCYSQAMQVYKGKGWSLAEDHINFTIGRQSFTLRQLENAVSAFRHILINDSKQTAAQQAAFLREYLYVYKNVSLLSPDAPLPHLPLPYIKSSATRVFFGHDRKPSEGEKQAATHVSLDQEYERESSQQWKELEEQVVAVVNRGTLPSSFQPTQYCLNSQTDHLRFPVVVVEEPITVEVVFKNPLKVPLLLNDLSLLWKFYCRDFNKKPEAVSGEPISNEKDVHLKATLDYIGAEVANEFQVNGEETKVARLKLVPYQTGELHILGVVYNLGIVQSAATQDGIDSSAGIAGKLSPAISVRGRQDLEIQGPRLNSTKEEKTSVKYGPDRRLDPIITEIMPLLEVFFLNFPTGLLCGEMRKAYVEFVNVSKCPLTGLKVVCKDPAFFSFGSKAAVLTPLSPSASENCSAYKTVVTDCACMSSAPTTSVSPADFGIDSKKPPWVIDVPLPDSVLLPGASVQLPMWLRGPDEEGVHEINFLFYYESTKPHSKLSHRVLRHTAIICTSRSLGVRATACRSNALEAEGESNGDNLLVFLDVENINTSEAGVKEFYIIQVSSGSKHWKLQKCINPAEDKDGKLNSREKAKLIFKATRCQNSEATSCTGGKYIFADIVLGNEQIISATTPCADFFFQTCCATRSKKVLPQPTMGHGRPKIGDANKSVQKCSEVDLNIIVLWKAYVVEDNKQLILEGQLHVTLETIGKEACSLPPVQEAQEMVLLKFIRPEQPALHVRPSMEQLSHLIKISLHYSESYDHPFQQKSLCLVPVSLVLFNCCQTDVDVIIDVRHKTTSPETLDVHGSFMWLGQTQYKLLLKGQEVHTVPLKACFVHAGVYNLGTPRVFAKLVDRNVQCETCQQTSTPALIIINNV